MAALGAMVNGNAFDFSSITLSVTAGASLEVEAVGITYQHALEPEELRGHGPQALYDTTGTYKASGSLELYLSEWRILRARLALVPGSGGYMQKRFDVIVAYGEAGEMTVTDTLRGCRVIRASKAYRRSNEPLMVSIDLYVREVLEDGVAPVSVGGLGELAAGLAGA